LRAVCLVLWFFLLLGGLIGTAFANTWLGAWDTQLGLASSLALVVAALSSDRTSGHTLAGTVAAAMFLGAAGDASPIWGRGWSAGSRLVTTMVLFGLGHLGYLAAIRLIRTRAIKNETSPSSPMHQSFARVLPVLLSIGLGIGSWYGVVILSDKELARQLHVPSLVYSLVLSLTAGGLLTLSWSSASYRMAGLGGILFFASDILLGLNIFQDRNFHHPIDWIWICYGVGQMFIVTSLTQIPHAQRTA